jgi:hypothetical protein
MSTERRLAQYIEIIHIPGIRGSYDLRSAAWHSQINEMTTDYAHGILDLAR